MSSYDDQFDEDSTNAPPATEPQDQSGVAETAPAFAPAEDVVLGQEPEAAAGDNGDGFDSAGEGDDTQENAEGGANAGDAAENAPRGSQQRTSINAVVNIVPPPPSDEPDEQPVPRASTASAAGAPTRASVSRASVSRTSQVGANEPGVAALQAAEEVAAASSAASVAAAASSNNDDFDEADDEEGEQDEEKEGADEAAAAQRAPSNEDADKRGSPQPSRSTATTTHAPKHNPNEPVTVTGLTASDVKLRFDIPELPDLELQQLGHLVREVRESELPDRVQQMRREVENQTIMVGTLSLEDLQKEEARVERERIEAVQKEMLRHQRRQADIVAREMDARKRLHAERQTSVLESREEAMALIARSMVSTKEQQQAFRKAEDRLKAALEHEKATVKVEFGDLVADTRAIKGRRYQVNWDDAPRLVCVKNMVMRAVKNKLPSGRYVMLCTIFDRLGGAPLRWSKLKDFNYFHRTQQPVRHQGRYFDVEISFKQRVNKLFLACPAKAATNPSMVFVFELFQVRNSTTNKTDRVVAWGAFPMSNPTGDIIKGHFKVPLLRGEMDPSIEKFSEIEQRMADNIDNWLCNLYFTVEHWPRYKNGQREFEVELKYTQELLQLPEFDRVNNPTLAAAAQAADDGEESEEDMGEGGWKQIWSRTEGLNSLPQYGLRDDLGSNSGNQQRLETIFDQGAKAFDDLMNHDISGQRKRASIGSDSASALSQYTQPGQKVGVVKATVQTLEKPGVVNVFEDLDLQQEAEAERVKAEREQLRLEEARRQTRLLQKYRYAIVDPNADVPQNAMAEKWRYIKGELRNEIGLHRIGTFEYWAFMLILFLMLWLRIYIHYLGEYLFLSGSGVTITRADIRFYTVYLGYNSSTIDLATELVTSFIGVVANQAIFFVLILLSYLIQKTIRIYPEMFSRIMLSYGIATLADPLLILLFDICDTYWSGDHFKLYNYYESRESNGVPGILLALAIGLFELALSGFMLYEYLLIIHANGRMLDLHRRLHGDEGSFFIPQDFEISVRTLRWIITKARRAGTGMLGAKNKIAVTSYTVRDHADPSFEATTIHLAIFKQPFNGEEQLFRHFVRQPDGAIVEIFDNVEAAGIDEYKKLEKRLDAKHNPTGPQLLTQSSQAPRSNEVLRPKRESLTSLAARRKSLN